MGTPPIERTKFCAKAESEQKERLREIRLRALLNQLYFDLHQCKEFSVANTDLSIEGILLIENGIGFSTKNQIVLVNALRLIAKRMSRLQFARYLNSPYFMHDFRFLYLSVQSLYSLLEHYNGIDYHFRSISKYLKSAQKDQ